MIEENTARLEESKQYFIIALNPAHKNSKLLTTEGSLRPELRRAVDYMIAPEQLWKEIKESYDVEISTTGVCRVRISFQCHGESHKTIFVHKIEKVFDVVLTLFVNKMFGLEIFKRMFVIRHKGHPIDPVVSFEWFDAQEVYLTVERIAAKKKRKKTEEADVVVKSKETDVSGFGRSKKVDVEIDESSNTTDSSTNIDLYVDAYSSKGCVGLPNLGNTCFMNSGIQCIINCKELSKYFIELKKSRELCRATDYNGRAGGRVMEEWCNLVYSIKEHSQTSVRMFKEAMGKIYEDYKGNDEQDSFEFVNLLLDTLHEELKTMKKTVIEIENSNIEIVDKRMVNDKETTIGSSENAFWNAFLSNNNTIISKLFYGLTKTALKCTSCGYVRYKNEPFMSLSLPIPSEVRYHPSITLVFEGNKPAIKVSIPMTLSIEELYDSISDRYSTGLELLATEYKGGGILRRLPSTVNISDVDKIVVFEYKRGIPYRLCTVTFQRLYFFKDKLLNDFIISADSSENMNILVYRKLEPFMIHSFSIEELFDNIEISYQPACPVFGIPTLCLHFPHVKKIFGSDLCIFKLNKEKVFPVSIADCLKAFTRSEVVYALCDECKFSGQHKMVISISRLPEILILHLKRYARAETKINSFVDFPVDDFVVNNVSYNLMGLCNHIEIGLGCGHYLAYVRREEGWYSCNDSVVSKCKEVDKKNAYVLFYRRAS
ncbi:hypothetical protein PAEPH01_0991 [Pancytospora epiphaga]|nr:hypothetical protein PAEPH01_0991 [Pancytospora epiphaga]